MWLLEQGPVTFVHVTPRKLSDVRLVAALTPSTGHLRNHLLAQSLRTCLPSPGSK